MEYLSHQPNMNTLSPEEVHFIEIPVSLINLAGLFQDFGAGHNTMLQTNSGISVENTCLICLQQLPLLQTENVRKNPQEIFAKICELLQVPMSEIEHDWDFAQNDQIPFCITCTKSLHGLILLKEQVEDLQVKLNKSLDDIRRTIQETNDSVPLHDLRMVNFRSKALGFGSTEDDKIDGTVDLGTGNLTSDLTSLFSNAFTNIVIQQDSGVNHEDIGNAPETGAPVDALQLSETESFNYVILPLVNADDISNVASESIVSSEETSSATVQHTAPFEQATFYYENEETVPQPDLETIVMVPDINSDPKFVEDNIIPPVENFGAKENDFLTKTNEIERKPRKASRHSRASESKQRSSTEELGPVEINEQGQLFYQGIGISVEDTGYVCNECGSVCNGYSKSAMRKLKIHIKGVHLGAYRCKICNKGFTTNHILSQHVVRLHQSSLSACDICLRPIKPRCMENHKYTHMSAEEKAAYVANGFKPPVQSKDLPKKFECKICNKQFKKPIRFRRHEATHRNVELRKDYNCDVCNRSYASPQSLKEHKMANHDQLKRMWRMCPICGKSLKSKLLQQHIRRHIPKENRAAHYSKTKDLQLHESNHDPSENAEEFQEQCDVCGKKFKTLIRMRNHRRKTHKNHWKLAVPSKLLNKVSIDKDTEQLVEDLGTEKLQHVKGNKFSYHLYEVEKLKNDPACVTYRCCTCSKEFSGAKDQTENDIKKHIVSAHIGNFRCNLCNKRMKNAQEVYAHQRNEHFDKKCLQCEVCGKPGISTKSYKLHVWTHKSIFDVATSINNGEIFPHRYSNASLHILEEFGPSISFTCGHCEKTFNNVESLYHHRLVNHPDGNKMRLKRKNRSESKSFKCLKCTQCFSTRKTLEDHKKLEHGIIRKIQRKKQGKC